MLPGIGRFARASQDGTIPPMNTTLFTLLLIGLVALYWQSSLRARERAVQACIRACREYDVQFLDQSVQMARIRIARIGGGRLGFRRWYGFEFSSNGDDRRAGTVVMLGNRPESMHLDLPVAPTLELVQ